MSDEDKEHIKIILIGDMSTGKTSLINAYFGMNFNSQVTTTLTPSVSQKEIKIEGSSYVIDMWDTAGQEKYRSMAKIFIKDSQIVIYVYDVTEEKTFDSLDYWVKSVEEVLGKNALLALVGNKIDLLENIKVLTEKGEKLAKDIGAIFYETSAKEDADGFQKFVKQLIEEFLDKNEITKGFGDKISWQGRKDTSTCSC